MRRAVDLAVAEHKRKPRKAAGRRVGRLGALALTRPLRGHPLPQAGEGRRALFERMISMGTLAAPIARMSAAISGTD